MESKVKKKNIQNIGGRSHGWKEYIKILLIPILSCYKLNGNVDVCQSTACLFLIWDAYLRWLEMCHCSFDATFSPDWQDLLSVALMSIFHQAFCYNKRLLLSLPWPGVSIKAILRYALSMGMSSLSKWHLYDCGQWNRCFSNLSLSLSNFAAYKHACVCKLRCYLARLFSAGFSTQENKNKHVQQQVTCLKLVCF